LAWLEIHNPCNTIIMRYPSLVLVLICVLVGVDAFQSRSFGSPTRLQLQKTNADPSKSADAENINTNKLDKKNDSRQLQATSTNPTTVDPWTKASWYAVEAFGKVFGSASSASKESPSSLPSFDLNQPPSSLSETLQRLQLDNDRMYFLSGSIDALIYDADCVFADPFVSFSGRDRFVANLQNLGSFITEYSAKPISYETEDDTNTDERDTTQSMNPRVTTKFMVKLRLNLPWKPVLAWPWGVTCEIDPNSFLIVRHVESWDIAPWQGVQQIFRKPTTSL
jgi:hypothetical protein